MKKILSYLDNIKEGEKLSQHTSLRIGGDARFMFEARNSDDVVHAVKTAMHLGVPYYILAGGTNILASDNGFNGLIIKTKGGKIKFDGLVIEAEAGASLPLLASQAARRGLSGLEWASGIPGTVGGAIFGNAGSFGRSMSEIVDYVVAYNPKKDEIVRLENKDCGFEYRNSIFKKDNLVVLRCALNLRRGDINIIQDSLLNNLRHKRENHPIGVLSAGCVFKNADYKSLSLAAHQKAPDLYKDMEMIPAGLLIERAGFKGYEIGDAAVSSKHANFILNKANARSEQVAYLIGQIKKKVGDQFGVVLEEEIRYIGDNN